MTDKSFLNHFTVIIGVLVAITAIILVAAFSLSSIHSKPDMAMMESMKQRLEPIGQVYIGDIASADQPNKLKEIGVTKKTIPTPAQGGKSIYNSSCAACHTAGIAGAPIFANKTAWAPRIATGIETLYNAALHGKGAMPAKGGNPSLSDESIKQAVDYMINAIQ